MKKKIKYNYWLAKYYDGQKSLLKRNKKDCDLTGYYTCFTHKNVYRRVYFLERLFIKLFKTI